MANVIEQVKSGATRFLEALDDAWRNWITRSGQALTRFTRRQEDDEATDSWGIVAGEIAETGSEVVVRLEAPGMETEDFDIDIEHGVLRIRGEKRFEHEDRGTNYHLFEAAYGSFERILPLPCEVDADRADARYRRGVLTVRIPKAGTRAARKIPVS